VPGLSLQHQVWRQAAHHITPRSGSFEKKKSLKKGTCAGQLEWPFCGGNEMRPYLFCENF